MKTQAFLALIAGILAIHTVVLYFALSGGQDVQKENTITAPVTETTTGAVSYDPNISYAPDPRAQAQIQKPTVTAKPEVSAGPELKFEPKEIETYSSARKKFGEPLNYRYAVSGNIPALPGSKLAVTGILVDLNTRNVLWSKNPDKPHPIASMTKVMTLMLAYEDVVNARGGVTLDTQIKVSRNAALVRESSVYLQEGEVFSLRDLMKAASIKSANDASYLIAEFLGGGDVNVFVQRMNQRAESLGMKNTKFFNPHGLPGKNAQSDNVSSPADMVILAEHTLEYPLLIEWSSRRVDYFRDPTEKGYVTMKNHNNLLKGSSYGCDGVNGLKTGFISRSGFCITVTCEREGRRLVAVMTGFPSLKDRDSFARSLIEWGYKRAPDPAAALKEDTVKGK